MASLRQRKLLDENNVTKTPTVSSTRSSRSSSTGRWRRKFFLLTGFSLITTLIVGSYFDVLPWRVSSHATNALDNVAFYLGFQKHTYAVIIDAGSTGSRVLAFSFHEPVMGEKNLKLDDELFVEVKPGLSSFADKPKEGAASLKVLLEKAKAYVPKEAWADTPLAMKATAGLRLLPKGQAEALLEEVGNVFAASPFKTNKNSVSIMDGVDEGLFSWFTVNFLLDRLGDSIAKTVAALDLGGGSTQITFAPSCQESKCATSTEFLHRVTAFHQTMMVYTHSYLGLGLMAARKAILSFDNPKNATTLHSECINPIISDAHVEWDYGGVKYKIKGSRDPAFLELKAKPNRIGEKRPIVRFDECKKIVQDYVQDKVDKPKELNKMVINAFSYYFDRATGYGLIDPFEGGIVKVKQFHDAAVATCGSPNTDQPFMCLDLTFISVLLQDGFGLKPDTELNLFKKIDGHEISWALGAAFHILQNGL